MTDRSVVVRLRAETSQYLAGLNQAKTATKQFGQEISGTGKTARADVEQVGRTALVMGGALAIGFGKGLQTSMSFEKQMSGVQAVANATGDEMRKLSDAALAAGANQKLAGVTASDAAKAEAELVKAGVSVSDVLGGALMGSLTLAAAGQLDFANAATIAAQAMNIFDLSGRDVTHIADVLAAAANKSAADVGQLGDALRQGGLLAAQTGLSKEETVAALAAFADNALIGSDAGTSLKTMLQRLTPVSKESADLMEQIGFSAYDAQGNFIGLEGLAQELQSSLKGMTNEQRSLAMATLFGSDAVRGANILYEEGAKGIREYVKAVDDQGAAARMAAIQNDNLSGDLEALGGAFETALIENGSKANDVLRYLAQTATGAVQGFSDMPSLVQSTAVGLGAVVTAGTLGIGVLGTFGPKIQQAKESMEGMGTAGEFLARNLGNIAKSTALLGAGLAVFAAWEGAMASARARADELSASWADIAHNAANTESWNAFVDAMIEVNAQFGEWSDKAAREKNPFKQMELQETADNLAALREEMELEADVAKRLAGGLNISRDAALEFVLAQKSADPEAFTGDLTETTRALYDNYQASRTGTKGSHELAGAMGTLGSEISSVEEQLEAFNDSLDALYESMFGVQDATDAWQRTVNDLPDVLKAAKEEGLKLKDVLTGHSNAAIDVRDHMEEMVQKGLDLISQWKEQGIEGKALQDRIDFLSAAWRQQAIDAGLPAPVIDHYLGLLDQIPTGEVGPSVRIPGAEKAISQLDRILARLAALYATGQSMSIDVLQAEKFINRSTGGRVPAYLSAGGWPWAARGTDIIPAMLSPGEYVMQKSAVDRFGVGFMDAINAGYLSASAGSTVSGASYDHSRRMTLTQNFYGETRRTAGRAEFSLRRIALEAGV